MKNKIESFSHVEYDLPTFTALHQILMRMKSLTDPFDRSGDENPDNPEGNFTVIPWGDWLPIYMLEHRGSYAKYAYPNLQTP